MNVTLSIDGRLVAEVIRVAANRGTTLNQLIRDYLVTLIQMEDMQMVVSQLEELWASGTTDPTQAGLVMTSMSGREFLDPFAAKQGQESGSSAAALEGPGSIGFPGNGRMISRTVKDGNRRA